MARDKVKKPTPNLLAEPVCSGKGIVAVGLPVVLPVGYGAGTTTVAVKVEVDGRIGTLVWVVKTSDVLVGAMTTTVVVLLSVVTSVVDSVVTSVVTSVVGAAVFSVVTSVGMALLVEDKVIVSVAVEVIETVLVLVDSVSEPVGSMV